MKKATLYGTLDAERPHVRLIEGNPVVRKPGRIAWLCKLAAVMLAGTCWRGGAAELCPVLPFVAITGRPSAADVTKKVDTLQNAGYDQFLVYARSGLQYTYMGEEWLTLVEQFCREAERRGMKVWLYDEYNWPSGTCRGRVPSENPAWRDSEWAVYRNDDGTFRWEAVLAPAGWVNAYEPDAVERFIELTHKVYEKRLAPWLANKTIVGIFTDEPGHPTAIHFEKKPVVHFRRFSSLEADYRATVGRDFRADVERWITDPQAAGAGDVWSVYADLKGRRFRSAYFDTIRAQCDRMGILSTGHMISENDVRGSCLFNGNPLHALKGLSLPGMDEIGSRPEANTAEWVTLSVVQHAIRRNGRGGLVELFALGPNDMTPARLRQMIWLTALHGVDHFLVSMEVMDMKGLVEKHGYLSPVNASQPWHGQMRPLLDDARRAASFARRQDDVRVAAVRYPQRLAALHAHTRTKRPDLLGLLRTLATRQVSLDLVEEAEQTDLPFVFAFTPEGTVREERSGRIFATAQAATDAVLAETKARFRVYETDSRTVAGELVVRNYADGAVAVLNLSATDRALIADVDGARVPFVLPGRGVLTLAPGERPQSSTVENHVPLDVDSFTLALDAANTWRVNFDTNKVGTITVAAPLRNVRLALRTCALSYAVTGSGRPVDSFESAPPGEKIFRHDAEPYTFEMDGRPLTAPRPCTALGVDFNPLYCETEPFELAPGVHTFRIVTGEPDQNFFLPALFVVGDFAVFNRILCPRPEKSGVQALAACGLETYAGAVTYTAEAKVPARAGTRLRLDTGGLFARVVFAGKDLGVRAWAPYEWDVPSGAAGQLEITVWTPRVAMCGAVDAPGAAWDTRFWTKPRTPGATGLLSASWVYP